MDQKKRFISVIFLGVLVLAAVFAWTGKEERGIDKSTYQVVFFDNERFYFGKLKEVSGQYLTFTDIYFVKNDKSKPGALSLFKYGDELHQPEDVMYISKDQVLYWQNLEAEGKVVQLIYQQKLQAAATAPATK